MEVVKDPDNDRDQVLVQLVNQYQGLLLRMCYIYLRDMEQAKDATQDTFLKAYRSLDSFRGECSEKTWLIQIAMNTCRDMQRSAWFRHHDRRITPEDLPQAIRLPDYTKFPKYPVKLLQGHILSAILFFDFMCHNVMRCVFRSGAFFEKVCWLAGRRGACMSSNGNQSVETLLRKDRELQASQERQLEEGLVYADRYVNRQYLVNLDVHTALRVQRPSYQFLRLYHIDKFIFDANEDINDKLISVYGALNTIRSNVIIVIQSHKDGVEFYMGTRCEQASTAGYILEKALKGNFGGSQLENLSSDRIQSVLADRVIPSGHGSKCVSSVTLVPSLRDEEKEHFVQGMEKLIDAMAGHDFTAILIAEPMDQPAIERKKRGLEELYATISPFSETTLAYGTNASYAVADGTFSSFADSINNSVTNSNSETYSESSTETDSSSSSYSFGSSSSDGQGSSSSSGASFSSGHSSSQTYGSSYSWSKAVTSGQTQTTSSGVNQTITNTIGESRTVTIKQINKSVTELMERIDQQLERIRACESFGLWSCAAYFVSDDIQVCTIAASSFRALIAGDNSYLDKAYINVWDSANSRATNTILQSIAYGLHPTIELPRANMFEAQVVKPTVLVSGKELPVFMSLPRKSVPGLVVDNMASFGRTVFNPYENPNNPHLDLGVVMHKGIPNEHLSVSLDMEEFRSHCFITGSTGSGKSNTTYRLLESFISRKIGFLVVEPAKGEYKIAFGKLPGINIFWTLDKVYPLLRLNPFSFPPSIHVLEHMDRLIEIFNACWPLYSAMPAILKTAVERAYTSVGWDLKNSIRIPITHREFPTFEDLLRELPKVIKESSYSAQTQGDYIGALVTRVSSLTNGIMGSVFCSGDEIPASVLFDRNTIVDLSRVGASETKSLLMGILVMKLNEHRMDQGTGMNARLKHITILEEAHNLLRRTSTAQSSESANVAGKSVEMISNSIAEMRTYGEGFIIVDQSPTAVDISAIKNTNTKIVMRLPEKADFEAVGNAFALSDEQIREIARLPRGAAIVSQSGWLEPVMVHVHRAGELYESTIPESIPRSSGSAIARFIATGLQDAENMFFNEIAVRKFLRSSQLPANQQDDLIGNYKRLERECRIAKELQTESEVKFIIDSIGCAALADIYPLVVDDKDSAKAKKQYLVWKQKISDSLETYGDFGNKEERLGLAAKLLLYAALVQKKPKYIAARKILLERK